MSSSTMPLPSPPNPLPKGNRIAIVTNSGGPGIMATDALIRPGSTWRSFSEETKKKLREKLPVHGERSQSGGCDRGCGRQAL